MPGIILGLGMDIVGPEMLSASKLSARRIIVESEHNPRCFLCPSPPSSILFIILHIHYEMDCVRSCLFCRFKDFSPEALVTFLLRLFLNRVMLYFHDGSSSCIGALLSILGQRKNVLPGRFRVGG
jgi:hypothetical protein